MRTTMLHSLLKSIILIFLSIYNAQASDIEHSVQTDGARAQAAPAIWQINDEDSTLYVMGTFHILPPELDWKTPIYEAAMKDADNTITEADTESIEALAKVQALIGTLGMNEQGTTLSSILGEKRHKRFTAACEKIGIPASALEPFKPWLAMITVSVVALQKNGFDPEAGVDKAVTVQAIAEADKITHFETAEQQVEILASLDQSEMLANFDVSLDQIEDFEALSATMLTAWSTGDAEALAQTFVTPLQTESPDAFQKLLVTRNQDWANQVETILSGEGKYFIAVGAAHLVGEKSLFDLLSDKGITAKRIQ